MKLKLHNSAPSQVDIRNEFSWKCSVSRNCERIINVRTISAWEAAPPVPESSLPPPVIPWPVISTWGRPWSTHTHFISPPRNSVWESGNLLMNKIYQLRDVYPVTPFKEGPRHGMMEHRAPLSPSAAPQYKLSPLMKQVFNESFPPATAATRGRRVVAREVRSNMVASALATLMLSCCCILLVEVCMYLVDWSIRTNIFFG